MFHSPQYDSLSGFLFGDGSLVHLSVKAHESNDHHEPRYPPFILAFDRLSSLSSRLGILLHLLFFLLPIRTPPLSLPPRVHAIIRR